jgi:hypothetical protein
LKTASTAKDNAAAAARKITPRAGRRGRERPTQSPCQFCAAKSGGKRQRIQDGNEPNEKCLRSSDRSHPCAGLGARNCNNSHDASAFNVNFRRPWRTGAASIRSKLSIRTSGQPMASRIPDLTLRIEGQELKRRSFIVKFRMATLYTPGPLEMNQLFSPHERRRTV